MFDLKKQGPDLSYDLEKGQNLAPTKQLISSRIEELKTHLRKGGNKEEFEVAETLLHGYTALKKVVDKIKK